MIYEVIVGGRTRVVDVVKVPSGWSLILDGRSHEVALEPHAGGTALYVDGQLVRTTPGDAARRFGRDRSGTGANGPARIVAPMPGRVVKVLVKPGDQVAARQPLVVVEAMKMENELRAPGPGTVAEVTVAPGASVEANAVLVVMTY